jgi:mRNA interferase HigB
MHIVSRKRLREFGTQYPDAVTPLDDWYRIVKRATWQKPDEVKAQFGSASFIGGTLTVFNVAGNKYRLVVNIRYELGRVFVMQVFTHRRYDEWNHERRGK